MESIIPLIVPLIEIAMLYLGLLTIYNFMRGSAGDTALRGVVILVAAMLVSFYIIATNLKLYRIELVLGKLLDYLLFVLIVIFQPELRRAVIRLGQNQIFGKLVRGKDDVVATLSTAVFRLARSRTGALIAVERGVGLNNFAEHGTLIDAKLTPELLETIFFPDSPLHDGAVIVRGTRVVAAGCLLPLTENVTVSKRLGTRHRAAIGVGEETDAIGIVVSEETGRVSITAKGELHQDLDREAFERHMREALLDTGTSARRMSEVQT